VVGPPWKVKGTLKNLWISDKTLPSKSHHMIVDYRSDGEGVGTSNSFQSQVQTPAPISAHGHLSPASNHDKDGVFGIGCTFRRDSRGRYRVKRVIKGGAARSSHSVLSGVFSDDFVLVADLCDACQVISFCA
jgi:hypothetical protein